MSKSENAIVLKAGGRAMECIGTVRLTPEAEKVVRRLKAKLDISVWAPTCDDATHKLTGILIGPECEYEWTGTGPDYDNGPRERDAAPTNH